MKLTPGQRLVAAGALATTLLLGGCGELAQPLARQASDTQPDAAAAANGINLAMFIGMDDYNGNTLPGIQETFKQLAAVGSDKRLGIFLSADSDVKNDGFRGRVMPHQAWGQGFIPMGELQTGRTPDLRNFLGWVGKEAPSRTTHLVLGSHGGGHAGIMWDYDGAGNPQAPSSGLTLQRTAKALSKGYTGSRMESLTFDACMMATIEVGEAIKGTAKVFTGSEDFSMGGSVPWSEVAGTLANGKNTTGKAFGSYLSEAVVQRGNWGARGSRTWSAISLDENYDRLVSKVDRLAELLIKQLKTDAGPVKKAAAETRMFAIMQEYASHYGDFYQRDLIDFCQALRRNTSDPTVLESAREVEAAVKQVVIGFAKDPSESMANGLAIFLPMGLKPEHVPQRLKTYQDSVFARHTQWDEFLFALNGAPVQ